MSSEDDLRHFGKLLKQIGFNADRPLTTQQAFLKHLLKAAQLHKPSVEPSTHVEGDQLTFDPKILGIKKI